MSAADNAARDALRAARDEQQQRANAASVERTKAQQRLSDATTAAGKAEANHAAEWGRLRRMNHALSDLGWRDESGDIIDPDAEAQR